MSNVNKQAYNSLYRIGTVAGAGIFGFALLEPVIAPFIPLIVAVLGGLIAGGIVRAFFNYFTNKKFNQSYRYSGSQSSGTGGSGQKARTGNRWQNTADTQHRRAAPPPQQPPPPPPDPLEQYRGVLGLEKNFTQDELKAAYRELAAQYHPDRCSSSSDRVRQTAEETMKRINEAYTRLKKA
ncbi:hypothetical protein FACS1894130_06970 [Spirochaetia bacterium]|nr:hypothetical protein FACS1894130_06970 [Spirochaetia bacterium]